MLSDVSILQAIEEGDIVISPFDKNQLNGASYNIRLGSTLLLSKSSFYDVEHLNKPSSPEDYFEVQIPREGYILRSGICALATSLEYTECSTKYVPFLDGRSSCARKFLFAHVSAGLGDPGFKGHWTLELYPCGPGIRLYPGDLIAQLRWAKVDGPVMRSYETSGRYQNQKKPTLSKGAA